MKWRYRLAAALLIFAAAPAQAAFDAGDLICETSTTTGTGTLNLAGAVANYATFVSQITSGSQVAYHIRASDGKLETGVGVLTDASPDTLTRDAYWSSDGSGAELTLPAGTHTVCLGPTTQMFAGMKGTQFYSKSASTDGGVLSFWHDSASPEYPDLVLEIRGFGGADDEQIGSIDLQMYDGTTAIESTAWEFKTRSVGSDLINLTLAGDGILSFDGWHITSLFELGALQFPTMAFFSDGTDVYGPQFVGYHDSTASVYVLGFYGYTDDSGNATNKVGHFILTQSDATATSEDAYWQFASMINGTVTASLELGNGGQNRSNLPLNPMTDDGVALGNATTARWSDLFLAEGGVINWDNGDATITQTSNDITFAGLTSIGMGAVYAQFTEIADPGGGAANTGRLYVRDNGSGKSQLIIVFNSGAAQVIATEP